MTLKEKIKVVLDKYNYGYTNDYAETMFHHLNNLKSLNPLTVVAGDSIVVVNLTGTVRLSIQELIGFCILANNSSLFDEKT